MTRCCCFGCCDALFPTNGLQRFLMGTMLMMLGSLGLLLAQLMYWKDEAETTTQEQEGDDYGQVPAYTAIAACGLVLTLSVAAMAVHLLCVCRLRQLQKSDQQALKRQRVEKEGKDDKKEEEQHTLWEWFFYPERETIPAAREATIIKRLKALARRVQSMYRQYGWSSVTRVFLLAPALALFGMLILRLYLGMDNFDGVPYNLDFGWKYGLLPHERNIFTDGDELYNGEAEKSTSFTPKFNSYGHAAQGFFSALLAFPVVAGLLLRVVPEAWWWKSPVHLAPFALAIYPTYNLVKRVLKAGGAFAGSSFANNGFEWAVGFVVACAVGNFCTSLVVYRRLLSDEFRQTTDETGDITDEIEEEGRTSDQHEENNHAEKVHKTSSCVKMIQILMGTVFAFTVSLASVLFGLTWHGCLEDSPDECVNFSLDGERASNDISVSFLVITIVALVGASAMECFQQRN
mmetsp:Transcript_5510/g.10704  ORF Transcript_5510/g.10704 Transcript_5510/m.10704 type:complete len:460 (-) Transcript_5510:52-1431(-)